MKKEKLYIKIDYFLDVTQIKNMLHLVHQLLWCYDFSALTN